MNKATYQKADGAADERMTVVDARKMLQVMNVCCKGLIFTKSELRQISMVCMKALEREEKQSDVHYGGEWISCEKSARKGIKGNGG